MSFGGVGASALSGGANAKGEFRDMVTGILYGAIGSTFAPMLQKGYKNNRKRRAPDPTNPFGNPLGFGLALLLLGRRFWRYSQSPHGARTGAAECHAGAKRRPKK